MKTICLIFTLIFISTHVLSSDEFIHPQKETEVVYDHEAEGLKRQDSRYFTEQNWPDKKKSLSMSQAFGDAVFIDELWNDREGKTCASISLTNDCRGNELLKQKILDFDHLLKTFKFEDLINKYILVPKYITSLNQLLVCDIDILRKVSNPRLGKLTFRTMKTLQSAIAPTRRSLFHLLRCVIEGAYFLESNGYHIHSLSPESLIHLGTNPDFLISNYSLASPKNSNFSAEIKIFIANILKLYCSYMRSINIRESRTYAKIHEHQKQIEAM